VRASASAPSFRRERSLKECQEQARLHLHAVLSQADDPEVSEQVKRAREEKARDFQRRVEAALVTVANLSNERPKKAKKDGTPDEWRASTTDADARVMKCPPTKPSASTGRELASSNYGAASRRGSLARPSCRSAACPRSTYGACG
jgi:hypothetical protein